ncbi:MAG: MarR family transcriptional regulator [Yoonia sp.]|uniref:MarR family winged helix-turn-helix transcriptional regulator n=1 Tax=Rhodobacterales TaxID=204455 RepID=UPI001FF5BB04|nr:MarR family transcriptional regulator [Loktanella sp. F6476L]MCK0122059.1 MarR family transcriptional regulator [Loktanella sp. F6476L]UWQ99570.1 MarR family transcriptional regulator [Rhodobacteraceae bacterium S2214]
MIDDSDNLAATLFSEILAVDQLARASVAKVLPKGMELSHFSVLNHLAHSGVERSPGELARTFHLTRGAMTNTLGKLEWNGWVHIRPDWDDARRKMVAISPAGMSARDAAIHAISPLIAQIVKDIGPMRVRSTLPVLREMRQRLADA